MSANVLNLTGKLHWLFILLIATKNSVTGESDSGVHYKIFLGVDRLPPTAFFSVLKVIVALAYCYTRLLYQPVK